MTNWQNLKSLKMRQKSFIFETRTLDLEAKNYPKIAEAMVCIAHGRKRDKFLAIPINYRKQFWLTKAMSL